MHTKKSSFIFNDKGFKGFLKKLSRQRIELLLKDVIGIQNIRYFDNYF